MSNPNMDGLPPEMQARIQQIIEGAKQKAIQEAAAPAAPAPVVAPVQAPVAPPAPPAPKPPNLMDHVIMLRQEVDAMRQQVAAMGQVVDACGQAVGAMYAMFQSQTEPTSYSSNFQAAGSQEVDEDY